MMRLSVDLRGDVAFLHAVARVDPLKHPEPFRRALTKAGFKAQTRATTVYFLSGGGPPDPQRLTSRSGRLRRSIALDTSSLSSFAVALGTNVVYGPPHEFGHGPLPPRPFIAPAIADVLPELPDLFADEWLRSITSGPR
jgi:hypothetical protein